MLLEDITPKVFYLVKIPRIITQKLTGNRLGPSRVIPIRIIFSTIGHIFIKVAIMMTWIVGLRPSTAKFLMNMLIFQRNGKIVLKKS